MTRAGSEDADHVNLERFRLGTEKVEAERAHQRAEQTEQARLRSEEHLREAEAARQQREAETARRRQEIEAARLSREAEEKKKRLDPAAPDYYDKLADRMLSTQYFEQSQAIDLLLRTDPTKVASAETRTKIAAASSNWRNRDALTSSARPSRGWSLGAESSACPS